MTPSLQHLLREIHHSIEAVARDLDRDRPLLAEALRQEAAALPGGLALHDSGRALAPPLEPLLYGALDEGVLDARGFDRLMIRHASARGKRTRRASR